MSPAPLWPAVTNWLACGRDFLYPPACALCGDDRVCDPGLRDVCPACCTQLLETADGVQCQRCGGPLGPYADPTKRCLVCRRESFAFTEVIRLGVYDGLLREACLRGKHFGGNRVLTALAELWWRARAARIEACRIDAVAAVPMSWRQHWSRPHDPAEVLGLALARRIGRPFRRLLKKTRATQRQSKLLPAQRRENVAGAYAARGAIAPGSRILLVDDILTTGATAQACAQALRKAGAARVVVAVIARGVGRR